MIQTQTVEKEGKHIVVDPAKVKMQKDLKDGQVIASRQVMSNSKEVAKVDVVVFSEDDKGLALAKSTLTLEMLKDLNRQTITDVMNGARVQREVTMETKYRRAKKTLSKDKQAEIDAKIAVILAAEGIKV